MTTVYDQSAILATTDDGGGNQNHNFRQFIPAAKLSSATGNQIQLVFLCGTNETSETPVVDEVWCGQGGVTEPNFTGDQVQIKFGGSASFNGSAAGVITSDVATLAQNFDNTKKYTVSWHIANAASGHMSSAALSTVNLWVDGGAASTASQTTPAGLGEVADTAQFLEKIIITAAGGDTLGGAMQLLRM